MSNKLIDMWTDPDIEVRLGDVLYSIERFVFDKKQPDLVIKEDPCRTCPYHKGLTWLTRFPWLVNVIRLNQKVIQTCHEKGMEDHQCAGARICLEGGSEEVRSVEEFLCMMPCETQEQAKENYYRLYPEGEE